MYSYSSYSLPSFGSSASGRSSSADMGSILRPAGLCVVLLIIGSAAALQESQNHEPAICNSSTTEKYVSFVPTEKLAEPKSPEYRKSPSVVQRFEEKTDNDQANDSRNNLEPDLKVYPLIDSSEELKVRPLETTTEKPPDVLDQQQKSQSQEENKVIDAQNENKNPIDESAIRILDHPISFDDRYPSKTREEKKTYEFSSVKLIEQLMNRDHDDYPSTSGENSSRDQDRDNKVLGETRNFDVSLSTRSLEPDRYPDSSRFSDVTERYFLDQTTSRRMVSRYSDKPYEDRNKDQDYSYTEPKYAKSTTAQQQQPPRDELKRPIYEDEYERRWYEKPTRKLNDPVDVKNTRPDPDDEVKIDRRIDGYASRAQDPQDVVTKIERRPDSYVSRGQSSEDDLKTDRRVDGGSRVQDPLDDDAKGEQRLDDYVPRVQNPVDDGVKTDRQLDPEDKPDKESSPDRRYDDKYKMYGNRGGYFGNRNEDVDWYTTPRSREYNISQHVNTYVYREWEESRPKLNFPKKSGDERYRMASLHLDKGFFIFDFLRSFLQVLQPRNPPLDLVTDAIEGKISVYTLFTKTIHVELVFMTVIVVFAVLIFVIPGTECYLCCKSNKYNYQRRRHGSSMCFLTFFAAIMGVCVITMLICNEEVASGVEKIPETVEAALQDLRDYHAGTAVQLRKCLTRSLDVASEAILADLDNVEELLGKPIQSQLSQETGVDVALEALMEVANASTELGYKTDNLLRKAERAREFGSDLSHEADEIRRDLERTTRDCAPEDRSLCAVLDPSGLHLALRLERVARDDRLIRLRQAVRDNLTEAGRQARGEFLYVTHHIARNTLDARNKIRREVNTARAKVRDDARGIEATGTDLTSHLDHARRVTNEIVPYIQRFEQMRWMIGFGTAMCVMFLWVLLFGALCCRCGSSEGSVRPTLLWFSCLSCLISILLWLVLIASLAIASHTEMLLCRPLDDPEFRTVEAVLETRYFLGKRLGVPLKDLLEKCTESDASYPAYQLDNSAKLEEITAHWTWSGLTRAFSKVKVDLTDLRIVTPNLRDRLQNLYYATGPNLTEHRVMIQGPILNKDLNALSDQVENVARQLSDRRTARSFQSIAQQMRELLARRVKPLMKMQDELVYQLATLELHLQPLNHKVNQTLMDLRNVQYYIDSQGEKIGQLKTKAYVDRMGNYLDQWRAHVLVEVSTGMSKCRPLWDILQGIKLLFCNHILGPFNGYWFAIFICVITMLIGTPTAHKLASSYWTQPSSKGSILLPRSREGSVQTMIMDRDTWRTPNPPSSMESW